MLYVPPPDLEARYEILRVHTRNMKIDTVVNLRRIAEDTELFTGAELEGLCREAGIVALRENITASVVCDRHFQTVKASLKPALTRAEIDAYSSFMKNPSVTSSGVEPGSKQNKQLFSPLFSVRIGVLSLILLAAAAAKYFLVRTDQTQHELATT